MTVPPLLAPVVQAVHWAVPVVIQPVQTTNQDAWWKWVALSIIGVMVLAIGTFAFLIARSFILDE